MGKISKKTLIDLEFNSVLDRIAELCISNLGKMKVLDIQPISNNELLFKELNLVNEYLSSFANDNRLPSHHFEEITGEIHALNIENNYLNPEAFLKLVAVSNTVNEILRFLKKLNKIYVHLSADSQSIEYTQEIVSRIEKKISNFGEVESSASPMLRQLRKEISIVRASIGQSFTKVLSRYAAAGYLDDIRESIIDNQRVLAVVSMHKKKVKGSLLGTSKTGSIIFIEPESTRRYTRELQNLLFDEKQEIIRILKGLTDEIREYQPLLIQYQEYLAHLDSLGARAKYGHRINACLPKIVSEKQIYFKDAFHPILLENNKAKNIKTVSQTLELNKEQQIIVISGPNAGGKSITLKTIGLLQLMLQSGLLIPVHERSKTTVFSSILTDIGDNQSIENQLSTYSYRLKNMRNFLRYCDKNTLFLIDEFGTGSDPELGGALAEVFLEEFYEKKAFGIITTHYANLKVLANELENVVNANMQFDEESLEPLFKLFIGQAGSSFTFEVAQKNGIPFRLINRAKKKVEGEKIRLDKTISKLQKERNKLQKTTENLEKEKEKAAEHTDSLSSKQDKIQEKLESFQELYDSNQKMLGMGRKINEISNRYFQTNNKKELFASFYKWITIEKSKYATKAPEKPTSKPAKKRLKEEEKKKKVALKNTEQEILEKVAVVREQQLEKAKKIAKDKASFVFKVNDKVRFVGGKSCGIIEKIEKTNAFINFGIFTTKTKLSNLEFVEKTR
ncbi:MAG: DNA mismatch repair protein MutS [Flavobacteriaceae bacterium]|nr:MAG: DNA mismatch repair protein MutS [Flavobacteriaceae bacterium]